MEFLETGAKSNPTFASLPQILWEEVAPTPLKNPRLAGFSATCAQAMGIRPESHASPQFTAWLNGEIRLPGDQRISTRYAGHQFGVWAGQLGDGRAISLLEFVNASGERWEIQTKGSGKTPFSRFGDGKAVIRSSVREFLCSEAMAGLGIPTTRALALLTGEDHVQRETLERSAILARAFPTNIRFGHFEYCAHFKQEEALRALAEYTRLTFFPELPDAAAMFGEVVNRTAALLAQWMSVGFCHGVMNTDNMSILGLTIDYGPFGFLERTDLAHICNHSDEHGRYAFQQQPAVALWNLERLAMSLLPLVPKETLITALETFEPRFHAESLVLFRKKLGLEREASEDDALFPLTLRLLDRHRLDFTSFFRKLPDWANQESLAAHFQIDPRDAMLGEWHRLYRKRCEAESLPAAIRRERMLAVNPKYVLRNSIAQEVIEAVENGDNSKLSAWLKILETPFAEHPGAEAYAIPSHAPEIAVSCSS